jgi:NAD(P)H-quinone oxidoreductase subunit 5
VRPVPHARLADSGGRGADAGPALLHAGVINLGGFLLLLMAPLMRLAELANWLLLIVAGLTCIAAALITMTRVSVKVLLAWSTVAQMGLMLVECALGQYGLALLHLVAHSCYKAYSFLAAGSEVENYLRKQLAPPRMPAPTTLPLLFGLVRLASRLRSTAGYLGPTRACGCCWRCFRWSCSASAAALQQAGSLGAVAGCPPLVIAYAAQKYVFSPWRRGFLPHGAGDLVCAVVHAAAGCLLVAAPARRQRRWDGACTATSTPVFTSMSGQRAPPSPCGRRSCPSARRRRRNAVFQNTEELS